jgi:hypothetical protein
VGSESAEDQESIEAVVDELNAKYALIQSGKDVVVLSEVTDPVSGHPRMQLRSLASLKEEYYPRTVSVRQQTARGVVLASKRIVEVWRESPSRRWLDGIVFDPTRSVVPGNYNLWRGWGIAANPDAICQQYLDHLRINVTREVAKDYSYLMDWLADLVQHPERKNGVAVIVRGKRGTGKTFIGAPLATILASHYVLVDKGKHLFGGFNSLIEDKLLVQAEEAFWAGEKDQEGTLKHLITGSRQVIERKYVEPYEVHSLVRLLVTSNEDWVIPAGTDERRFFVLECGDAQRGQISYFARLDAELRAGGAGKLLHLLLTREYDPNAVRLAPQTEGLRHQQVQSLPVEAAWWLGVLTRGYLPGDVGGVGTTSTEAIYAHYHDTAHLAGVMRKRVEQVIAQKLREWCPKAPVGANDCDCVGTRDGRTVIRWLRKHRRTWQKQLTYVFDFPPLAQCRAAFVDATGWTEPWSTSAPTEWVRDEIAFKRASAAETGDFAEEGDT